MTHLPIDPFSAIALALLLFHIALTWLRRRRERAHGLRLFRSVADLGRNERGSL